MTLVRAAESRDVRDVDISDAREGNQSS